VSSAKISGFAPNTGYPGAIFAFVSDLHENETTRLPGTGNTGTAGAGTATPESLQGTREQQMF